MYNEVCVFEDGLSCKMAQVQEGCGAVAFGGEIDVDGDSGPGEGRARWCGGGGVWVVWDTEARAANSTAAAEAEKAEMEWVGVEVVVVRGSARWWRESEEMGVDVVGKEKER